MTKQRMINELKTLVSNGSEILKTKYNPNCSGKGVAVFGFATTVDNNLYISWHTNVTSILSALLPEENHYLMKFSKMQNNTFSNASACTELLKNLIEQIEKGVVLIEEKNSVTNNLSNLYIVFLRFHHVVRQLRSRYNNRNTLDIEDEYDVQDLLHALLKLYFDDVRTEEWVPSYAGGSSRMDFLLKDEKVVIEVKKTRSHLRDRDLGEQLIIDIEKYQAHPDCERLICFVYDPEGLLGNPAGIEKDLKSKHGGFVDVIIKP